MRGLGVPYEVLLYVVVLFFLRLGRKWISGLRSRKLAWRRGGQSTQARTTVGVVGSREGKEMRTLDEDKKVHIISMDGCMTDIRSGNS
jgi:hypothetical protein